MAEKYKYGNYPFNHTSYNTSDFNVLIGYSVGINLGRFLSKSHLVTPEVISATIDSFSIDQLEIGFMLPI